MAEIDVQDIIDTMHRRCADTTHTKEESRDAYVEILEAARTAADALDEEIEAEGEDTPETED